MNGAVFGMGLSILGAEANHYGLHINFLAANLRLIGFMPGP